jgi:hypothetical protein
MSGNSVCLPRTCGGLAIGKTLARLVGVSPTDVWGIGNIDTYVILGYVSPTDVWGIGVNATERGVRVRVSHGRVGDWQKDAQTVC